MPIAERENALLNNSSLSRSADSALLRSEISKFTPTMFWVLPLSSTNGMQRASSQRTVPSGHNARYSVMNC
jgi:hypothetical protein